MNYLKKTLDTKHVFTDPNVIANEWTPNQIRLLILDENIDKIGIYTIKDAIKILTTNPTNLLYPKSETYNAKQGALHDLLFFKMKKKTKK